MAAHDDDINRYVHTDTDAVGCDLRAYVVEHLGDPDAVLGRLREGEITGRAVLQPNPNGGTT